METTLKQPLTNVQLELLKMFSYELSDQDILDLKNNLAVFFSNKLIAEADKYWLQNDFSDEKIEDLLHTKMRISKK